MTGVDHSKLDRNYGDGPLGQLSGKKLRQYLIKLGWTKLKVKRVRKMRSLLVLALAVTLTGGCACVIPVAGTALAVASVVVLHDPLLLVFAANDLDACVGREVKK